MIQETTEADLAQRILKITRQKYERARQDEMRSTSQQLPELQIEGKQSKIVIDTYKKVMPLQFMPQSERAATILEARPTPKVLDGVLTKT